VTYSDPYQAYLEGSVFASDPLSLVVTLYEGAVDAVRQAKTCFETGDIFGRSKAITKAFRILAELTVSLDHERGGEVSANLKRLYAYMQSRVLEAHAQKTTKPLIEVEQLLTDMLSAWRVVAEREGNARRDAREVSVADSPAIRSEHVELPYGGYFYEPLESFAGTAATF
jgi:flagellar protein FliS